ncbi:MAG: hypothetical protein QNJ63_09970 [Calothrix sp. MO_192.B10]|nr:hypothetical protein [Calothrix sp. MO_192.B10]
MSDCRKIISVSDDDLHSENEVVILPEDNDSPTTDLTPVAITGKPLQQFWKFAPQLLHEGGPPAALILALGAIAIPLALIPSNLIAGILAGGAVMVAVIYAIGTIIC